MLYFAYGSNLSKAAMRGRAPAAIPLGRASLPHHRLAFRLWADAVPSAGSRVVGGLWRLTPACLAALDDYEDVAAGLYGRHVLAVLPEGGTAVEALVYRMPGGSDEPPEPAYLALIRQGYRDFGLDEAALAPWTATEPASLAVTVTSPRPAGRRAAPGSRR